MPNKKSAKKELRKTIKRVKVNNALKDKAKKLVKESLKTIEAKAKNAEDSVRLAIQSIDKLAKKGVIKKNNASRRKSKLQKKANQTK